MIKMIQIAEFSWVNANRIIYMDQSEDDKAIIYIDGGDELESDYSCEDILNKIKAP